MKIVSFNPVVKNPTITNKSVTKYNQATDTITLSKQQPAIGVFNEGKNLHVSFTGKLQNPIEPGIQFKISGVTKHQKGTAGAHREASDDNLVKLAASKWKDGQKLDFEHDEITNTIILKDKKFGAIGDVPSYVTDQFMRIINQDKENFQFELTNVTGGVTSDFPIIAAKASLKYTGDNKEIQNQTQKEFNNLINSDDKRVASSVGIYQPKVSPTEVLQKIFDIEGKRNGLGEVRQIKDAIDTITKELNDPKNKNILVLGHSSPDGDTVGCVVGMQAALKGAYPERMVDAAIDDDIPNTFINVPGVKDIKRPFNQKAVNAVKKNIELLERNKDSEAAKAQIEKLNKELERLTDESKLFDPLTAKGGKAKQYDLIIMLDTPIPGRSSRAFKPYFENAGKTIFIDHHPHKPAEWQNALPQLGFDMAKTCKDKLALVVDSVPAATQLVTVVAEKAGLLGKMFKNSTENAKKFVAGILAGTQTDTCGYKNAASYHPSEARLDITEKSNYYPEGMSNWLVDKLDGSIDKKWLREKLFYELPNNPVTNNLGPKDAVLKTAIKNREMHSEIGLGIMKVSYALMENILKEAKKQDENVTMTDVYNAYKNCEVMSALKADPKFTKSNPNPVTDAEKAAETYRSNYDDDRVAVFMAQNQQQGELNKFSQIADKNIISFSFRSGGKSNAAQVLATIFGGGGHAAAAGANIAMKDLTFNSKLKVKINGKEVDNAKSIYEAATNNIKVSNDNKIPFAQKSKLMKKIEIEMSNDESGKTCSEIIADVTAEIRKTQSTYSNARRA